MSYNDEAVWTNQQILFHKDIQYGSNSLFDITLTSTSDNFKNFSSPKLKISIISFSDNSRRYYNLTIQDSLDLLNTINSLPEDISISYKNNHVIVKRYNKNKDLIIQFKKSRTGDRCVILRIFLNDSDFGRVIFPLLIFQTFSKLLKQYIDNYISIIHQVNNITILKQNQFLLDQINNGIKILPTSINQQIPSNINNSKEPNNEDPNNEFVIENNSTIQEFDEFIGGSKMDKVEIDNDIKIEIKNKIDIKKIEDKPLFNITFFNDFLKGNILVLEDVLNSIFQNNNPVISFLELLNYKIPNYLTDEDLKSICYIPRVIFLTTLRKFVELNVIVPSSIPILKFQVQKDKITKAEKDLMLDFLTIQAILKLTRIKLESKNENQLETKAIINIAFRCFTDVFVFSYLEVMDLSSTKTSILERFKYLKSNNFFKDYERLLENNKCTEISEIEIIDYVNSIFEKVVGKNVFLEELQNDLYNKRSLKLPYNNKFSLEQIINEIIPIETFQNINNNNLKNSNDVYNKLNIQPSEKVSDLFFEKNLNRIAKKKEIIEKLNIQKLIEEYIEEVPEEWKNPLLKYLSTIKNEKFDFSKFPVIEFGDNIVKILYNWNPIEENSDLTNYVSFRNKVKNSILSKNDILNLINETKKSNKDEELWDSISFE